MDNDSTSHIFEELRAWVEAAPSRAQLPTTRALTAAHGASPVTIQKVLRRLVALGLIESRPGVGAFVLPRGLPRSADLGWQTAALGAAPARIRLSATQRTVADDVIALHSGYPAPALLPEQLVRTALIRAARTPRALAAMPAAGLAELRAWFAADLAEAVPADAPRPSARDVVIVPGSQSALSSVFRAVAGHERAMVIESPSYWGAVLAAEQTGIRLVPIPTTADGPDPRDVERALQESGARAFYAQPTFANPTAALWSAGRRREVLDVIRAHGAFLIEDDWARDLAIDAGLPPIAAFDEDGHVVYIRSLTKSVSPSLRVAAVVARGPVRERILADRAAETMYVSGVLQAAALDVVSQPGWRAHLRSLRTTLRDRRDALLAALREHAPSVRVDTRPLGGLTLWARLPDHVDAEEVARLCELRGLAIAAGGEWFPAEAPAPYVRLSFAGPTPERFDEAARILADVLRETGAVSS
ncbi:DNA-binding transcriptional MocR family regulator [Microbacterium resistens]|uniref:DNA-binding transcriptional MocR family regulator n=1 Tax=Microbacterium resistens TaxID=156977 RepID=A0ABU1SGB5_9MICO|nr:PLP-dependent aminotransferase family protein [Microbacterium resistens]MDR6868592.1 DNA-binding transcriptional MocR family regulator [Microbacterium resistens]